MAAIDGNRDTTSHRACVHAACWPASSVLLDLDLAKRSRASPVVIPCQDCMRAPRNYLTRTAALPCSSLAASRTSRGSDKSRPTRLRPRNRVGAYKHRAQRASAQAIGYAPLQGRPRLARFPLSDRRPAIYPYTALRQPHAMRSITASVFGTSLKL